MKRVLIALLTITMTSGVALFCPGTSGVGGAFAAETSGVANTSEFAAEEELPDNTEISEADEASGEADAAEETVTEEEIADTETPGVADTSEEEVSVDTETPGVAVTAAAAEEEVSGVTETSEGIIVELNSGAERNGEFTTVNKEFQTENGTLALIMNGLKDGNKDLLLAALAKYYDAESDKMVKVIDAALPDAEKWDAYDESVEAYDYGHCWAASASNMLWVSGWAGRFVNPDTGAKYSSEDEVFTTYNRSFSNAGAPVDRGIDWFFMGEFCPGGVGKSAFLKDENSPYGGVMKSFVSTLAQQQYKLTENVDDIAKLERIAGVGGSTAVFQASVGGLAAGEIANSEHSITVAGVIIDPGATAIGERYKGIAIIDSDNDGRPSEEALQIDNPIFEQKQADKAARPNSCTFYPLRLISDINGTPCWEIVGFDELGTEIIYSLDALELPSEDLIEECTESEGNCSVVDTVDLTLDDAITTDETEEISDYNRYIHFAEELKCTEFKAGLPINLNYFVTNRSGVILDEDYTGGKKLSVGWSVSRDSDGAVVAEGSHVFGDDLYSRTTMGAMIHLNKQGDGLAKWEAGDYTVSLILNSDRAIEESYYLNNIERSLQFTVTEAENSEEGESVTPAEEDEPEDTPEEETSEDTSEKEEPSDKPKDSEKTAEKEETSKESEKTTEKKETSEASKKARDETNTGDDSNASAWIVLMALAAGALGGIAVYRRKNK